jgi:hypothetical protein
VEGEFSQGLPTFAQTPPKTRGPQVLAALADSRTAKLQSAKLAQQKLPLAPDLE